MKHSPPGRGAKEKPQNTKNAMLSLFKYLKPWYKPVAVALVFSLLSTALTLIAPDKLAKLTDTIAAGLVSGIDMSLVIGSIVTILIIYISANLAACASSYMMITVMQRLAWSMRGSISKKINRLPLRFFDKTTVGDVLSHHKRR